MSVSKITKRTVDATRADSKRDVWVFDSELKGFALRVRPSGHKSYCVKYRTAGGRAGTVRRALIGEHGVFSPDEARQRARALLGDIAKGEDPAAGKAAERRAERMVNRGHLWLKEIERTRKPATASKYSETWKKHIEGPLGYKRVEDVTFDDVARIHTKLHERPIAANRVVAILRSFFSHPSVGRDRDNPARGHTLYPERPRGHAAFLSADDFKRLGDALTHAQRDGLPPAPTRRQRTSDPTRAKHRPKTADNPIPANPYAVAVIRLCALTGCRVGEVLSLRWDAVDFARGWIVLGETKTGPSLRPLAAAAAALLTELPRLNGSPYVFPGDEGKPLATVTRLWYAVRHAANLPSARLHDLRHSFASVAASSGESMRVVQSLLGHAQLRTTERYAHLAQHPIRTAADKTAGDIASWMSGASTPVTPLRSAAGK